MKVYKTGRGFARADFVDYYGHKASIQESSIVGAASIWLGCDTGHHFDGQCLARMHLTQSQVRELLPLLERFAETGLLE